jgi:hypothetical protein
VLYRVFLVTCTLATAIGLLLIWGLSPDHQTGPLLLRVLGTCVVLAVASAFTMSATRLVAGRAPEDDDG